MRILVFSRYGPLGASSRIRCYQYLPFLKSEGAEITVFPLLSNEYLRYVYSGSGKPKWEVVRAYLGRAFRLLSLSNYDLIWIDKELFPFLPAWGEAFLNYLRVPYVVDYDDAIFHNYDCHQSALIRALLGRKIDRVMGGAVLVIAGNDYLADRAHKAGAARVEVLPSVVDLDRYTVAQSSESAVFTVGWIGSPTTAKFIRQIEGALSEVCGNGTARLVLVGSGEVELDGIKPRVLPWTEDSEISSIQSFDVGIMPLSDAPWSRGKCGYKLVQYMACGRPVIASPVGVNKQIVEHGINGFLASTDEEWKRALNALSVDFEMCTAMGKAARKKVEAEYSLQKNAPRLLGLLKSAASGGR